MTVTTEHRTVSLTGDYVIDPAHSRLGFSARHAMVATVHGQFVDFEGKAHLDEEHPESSYAEIVIDVASLSTGNADRDAHLRSADFFDVENYPTITFRSTSVNATGAESYVLTGDLTIRDVTRAVDVEFEGSGVAIDPWGKFRAGFEGSTTVNRKDWNLTWNMALEAGGILVGDKVKLTFDIAAVRQD